MVGAHHDTVPEAPGAYDDGGGVGILIELARALAQDKQRSRTLVFVSFDGEESESVGKGSAAGSRAFVERLGPRARSLVAAFAVDMSGWSGGAPALHPIAYADPRERAERHRPGLARAHGARRRARGGLPVRRRRPLALLALPAGRAHVPRAALRRRPVVPAGGPRRRSSPRTRRSRPSIRTTTRPPTRPTGSTLRPSSGWGEASLGRRTRARACAARPAPTSRAGSPPSASWSVAVAPGRSARLSLVPGLLRGLGARAALALGARIVQALVAALLFWRHPVPALWVLLAPAAAAAAASARGGRRFCARAGAGARGARRPCLVPRGRERSVARALGGGRPLRRAGARVPGAGGAASRSGRSRKAPRKSR